MGTAVAGVKTVYRCPQEHNPSLHDHESEFAGRRHPIVTSNSPLPLSPNPSVGALCCRRTSLVVHDEILSRVTKGGEAGHLLPE